MPIRSDNTKWVPVPPAKAIQAWRQKGYRISWNWDEVWQAEHAKAFTVAHCAKLDVLQDIRAAVDRALADGDSYGQFREKLVPILQEKGWWGELEGIHPESGLPEVYQAGSFSRLETIFRTNLSVAYATGQYRQDMDQIDVTPYWQYDAVADDRTRPEHRELDGQVFRADDPIWDTIYPPNGWNCRCSVIPLTDSQAEGHSISSGNDVQGIESAIPEEWRFNPAKDAWAPDLSQYDPDLAAQYRKATE